MEILVLFTSLFLFAVVIYFLIFMLPGSFESDFYAKPPIFKTEFDYHLGNIESEPDWSEKPEFACVSVWAGYRNGKSSGWHYDYVTLRFDLKKNGEYKLCRGDRMKIFYDKYLFGNDGIRYAKAAHKALIDYLNEKSNEENC